MHGIILTELEKFVTQHHGADAWREVQRPAELPPKVSVTSATYPDTDVVALMSAASALTGKPASEVMEADEIALQEPQRMLKGAGQCRISVRLRGPTAS